MSEKKRKVNPWVPAVVMGVVAILFSIYAFQSQVDVLEARKEIEQLKSQVKEVVQNAERQQEMARKSAMEAQKQNELAAAALKQTEENCKKSNKRK